MPGFLWSELWKNWNEMYSLHIYRPKSHWNAQLSYSPDRCGGGSRSGKIVRAARYGCEQYFDHLGLGDTHQLKRGHGRTANSLVTAGGTPAAPIGVALPLSLKEEKEDFHVAVKGEQTAKPQSDWGNI